MTTKIRQEQLGVLDLTGLDGSGISDIDASNITSGTLADARVSQSSVTQHEGALSITEGQISDLGNYSVVGHSHTKSDITDFAHTHVEADITNLGSYLTDAPSDGNSYARNNGAWSQITSVGTTILSNGSQSIAGGGNWVPPAGVYTMLSEQTPDFELQLFIGSPGAWVAPSSATGIAGTIICDGVNVRIANTGGGAKTVYWQKYD